ncbi:MAG: HD domain-containing protein [Saprospiraceae bacterium]|nr:HD domain-containing protein [Saprospiraceae bacterium]
MATSIPTIDHLMQQYKHIIRNDFDRYNNHVYRVFLNCKMLDDSIENEEKYAIAAVFHDIGIWTDHTIDYLNPSIIKAKEYLNEVGKLLWMYEIALMIDMHHKMSKYNGKYEATVEVFRKADWMDVSLGLLNFGVNKQFIKANQKQYKNLGFHQFLIKATTKNFLQHPFRNPLPMFKK